MALKMKDSKYTNDLSTNGGIWTNTEVPTNSAQNIFPHVTEAERTAGNVRWRKKLLHKESGDLAGLMFFISKLSTAADHYVRLKRGSASDVQETADDYGWSEAAVTWDGGSRKVTTGAQNIAVGDEIIFLTAGGAFRGRALVASVIDTTNFTIDAVLEGADPQTGDTAATYWIGSGDVNEDLDTESGNTDPFEVAFDSDDCIYVGATIRIYDWDTLGGDGYPTWEDLTVSGLSWVDNVATITTTTDCTATHSKKTQGVVEGTGEENFDLDGLTLIISINGGDDQTITFAADGMTAAQVETYINTYLVGGTAAANGTKINISTDDYYKANSIQVKTESTAKTELGLDTSIHYGTDGTVCAVLLQLGTIESSHTDPVDTTAGDGTWDESGHPVETYEMGTITGDVTVTFTSATEFDVEIETPDGGTIELPSGETTEDYEPAHDGTGSYYFKIPSAGWVDTWAANDTLEFTTYGAYVSVWFQETVEAGAAAHEGNRFGTAALGNS